MDITLKSLEIKGFSFDQPHSHSISSEIIVEDCSLINELDSALTKSQVCTFIEELLDGADVTINEFIVERGFTLDMEELKDNF